LISLYLNLLQFAETVNLASNPKNSDRDFCGRVKKQDDKDFLLVLIPFYRCSWCYHNGKSGNLRRIVIVYETGVAFMKGVKYVVDDKGDKTAVIIDLKKYGELWEDFQDTVIAQLRANEPRETLESVKKRLGGKLVG
jgi:hypothetical protein